MTGTRGLSERFAASVGALLERRVSRRGALARAAVAGSAFAVAPVRYQGGGLCHQEGVRYYVDCNRIPGHTFAGGCQCANGDCRNRRVDCNHFRYGQCNTQVRGTTEVVCRLVICQNPATVPEMNCNGTEMVDDNTCMHEAGCLDGLAVQLPGGGGV